MRKLIVLGLVAGVAALGALTSIAGGANQAAPARLQVAQLVGRWAHLTTCQELVSALKKAGLKALAPGVLAGNGLVSGTAKQLAHKRHICAGAPLRLHSHFFT